MPEPRPLLPRPLLTRRAARTGFTLAEVLVAGLVLTLVVSMAVAFVNLQAQGLAAATGRLDATQAARFAQTMLDRELRMAGVNTLGQQPAIVAAGPYAVTFNADLVTSDEEDVFATYWVPTASPATTRAMQPPGIRAALTTLVWPTAPMLDASGMAGRAETISFWARPDSTSTVPDQWVLFRRVNAEAPTVVATGLYLAPGEPLFKYLWIRDSTGVIDTLPAARQPLLHGVPLHGAAADTGETRRMAAPVDRIRAVVVRFAGQYRDPHAAGLPVRRAIVSRTTLINPGMLGRVGSCGQPPDPVTLVGALLNNAGTGLPDHVRLVWTRGTDDGAGERDVERYLVYRRENGGPWGDPLDEVPTTVGAAGYTWTDYDVKRQSNPTNAAATSNTFEYAVVVQDCQPSVSTRATFGPFAIPLVP